MQNTPAIDLILAKADDQEKRYDWLGAVESYKTALAQVLEQELSKKGDLHEQSGCALYMAARQSDNVEQFRERTRRASEDYQKASICYEKLGDPGRARALRSHAMVKFMSFWLAEEAAEKKKLVNEAWRLTIEALNVFQQGQEAREYGKTYDQLSIAGMILFHFQEDSHTREAIFKVLVGSGDQAVSFLSPLGESSDLVGAYVKAAGYLGLAEFVLDTEQRAGNQRKATDYWRKAQKISEEMALLELSTPEGAALTTEGMWDDPGMPLKLLERALDRATKTRDALLLGTILEWSAWHTFWTFSYQKTDERIELVKKALKHAEDAKKEYSRIAFASPGLQAIWVEEPYAEVYWDLANYETDLNKKLELLETSRKATTSLLIRAQQTGYPITLGYAHHVAAKVFASRAKIEANNVEKKKLLEKALEHRNETIRIDKELSPFAYWNNGVYQNYLALIKSSLSELSQDHDSKNSLLEEAAAAKETGIKLCLRDVEQWETSNPVPSNRVLLGNWQLEYGDLLNHLYETTGASEHLEKAGRAYLDSARSFHSPNLPSRIAEAHWKAASAFDGLGDHSKATENFVLASDNYKLAAEKIKQLEEFYKDYASYMQAWSEIERAKHHHSRQEYGQAREHYERAAGLHASLKQWSYLAPNYHAWAQVDDAEDLSRSEQSNAAVKAFEHAAQLFQKGQNSLQAALDKIENLDEKQMIIRLVKAVDQRREYCNARIALEEARAFAHKGDLYSSSENYGKASETLERMVPSAETETARRELKLMATLSKAWQLMTRAEDEASPGLYLDASRLFEEAKELSPSERARSLALGHSRFCRALEAGTKFSDAGEPSLHDVAVHYLESAANYYLKAEFKSGSEYAKATQLLFDAYARIDKAKKEEDPDRKTRLYMMSEKILQASADAYLKAEQLAKREQVLKLLGKVKEERELAMSLTEVLHGSTLVSTTTSFAAPIPTREAAVGLDRFEHADIQAKLIALQKDLKIGESLNFEIELVNAGRGPAQLVKLEAVIPDGFDLTEKPEYYRVEDSYLNMKGKRLDPLKTEEVKLVLKPKAQGRFTIKPRILYLDESGKYKSHDPEPVEVTVKELGISGWLKG